MGLEGVRTDIGMGNDVVHAFGTQVDIDVAVKDHQLVEGDGGAAVEFGDHGFADQALAGIQGNGDGSAFFQAVIVNGGRVQALGTGIDLDAGEGL